MLIRLATVIGALVCAAALLPGKEESPSFYVESGTALDLGRTPVGNQLTGAIRAKNLGTEKIEITQIAASCGCTSTGASKWELAPGEETEIEVKLKGKMRAESLSSDIAVEWESAGEGKNVFKVHVVGQFVAPFQLNPDIVSLQIDEPQSRDREREIQVTVRRLEPTARKFKLESNFKEGQSEMAIKTISEDESQLTIKVRPAGMFDGSNRFEIKVIGLDDRGRYIGENSLPVVIAIKGDVQAKPGQVLVSVRPEDDELQRDIALHSASNTAFTIERVYSDSDWLSGESVKTIKEDASQTVHMKIKNAGVSERGSLFVVISSGGNSRTLCFPVVQIRAKAAK